MKIIDALNWRYAAKTFVEGRRMTAEQEALLTDAVHLSPSSFGLQPYRLVKVEDSEIRNALVTPSFGQDKVAKAGHLWVFVVPNDFSDQAVDTYIQNISDTRGVPIEMLVDFKNVMKQYVNMMSVEARVGWAKHQAYLALGNLLTVAAHEGIDSCPMEGINPASYDEMLGLTDKNLTTAVVVTLGTRAEGDEVYNFPKVRTPRDAFVLTI